MNFFRATVGVAAKSASTRFVSGSARSRSREASALCDGRDGCAGRGHETNLGNGEKWLALGNLGNVWIFKKTKMDGIFGIKMVMTLKSI
jgi:hypothetical protein